MKTLHLLIRGLMFYILTICATFGVIASANALQLGPYKVGVQQIIMNPEPSRPLLVYLFYPTSLRATGTPVNYTTYGLSTSAISITGAIEGPPISSGKFPLVVYSHGFSSEAFDQINLIEALVSQGFIVAAPNHTGNDTSDVTVDGINAELFPYVGYQVLPCSLSAYGQLNSPSCSLPGSTMNGLPVLTPAILGELLVLRYYDIENIINTLTNPSNSFSRSIDASRIGLAGYSLGSVTVMNVTGGNAALGLAADPRIKAVMAIEDAAQITAGQTPAQQASITAQSLDIAGSNYPDNVPGYGPSAAPTLGVVGSTDNFNGMINSNRRLVILTPSDHLSFDSNICENLLASYANSQNPSIWGPTATDPVTIDVYGIVSVFGVPLIDFFSPSPDPYIAPTNPDAGYFATLYNDPPPSIAFFFGLKHQCRELGSNYVPFNPPLNDPDLVGLTTVIYGVAFFDATLQNNWLANLLFIPFNASGNPNVHIGIINQVVVKAAGHS